MRLTESQLERYRSSAPLEMDEEIRGMFGIPDDRYYSVVLYPPKLAGDVRVDTTRFRVAPKNKISKSNQP